MDFSGNTRTAENWTRWIDHVVKSSGGCPNELAILWDRIERLK